MNQVLESMLAMQLLHLFEIAVAAKTDHCNLSDNVNVDTLCNPHRNTYSELFRQMKPSPISNHMKHTIEIVAKRPRPNRHDAKWYRDETNRDRSLHFYI